MCSTQVFRMIACIRGLCGETGSYITLFKLVQHGVLLAQAAPLSKKRSFSQVKASTRLCLQKSACPRVGKDETGRNM